MTNSARNTQNLTNIENTARITTRASNFETRRFILSAGLREILETLVHVELILRNLMNKEKLKKKARNFYTQQSTRKD